MDKIPSADNNPCPEAKVWADRWIDSDREYIEHRARFAPEPVKSIARLILAVADSKAVNTSGQ